MTRLIIAIEGGLVQAVCSDNPAFFSNVEVVTTDYDTEGADRDEISLVKQKDGTWAEAIVIERSVDQSTLPGEIEPATEDDAE